MTLKTLKDIQIIGPDGVEDNEYVKRLLRAEAVKWVKKFDKEREDGGMLRGEWEKNWIKHFFNLTEADLQEEKK